MDVSLEDSIIPYIQVNQQRMIGKVGIILGDENLNIKFMSIWRISLKKKVVMAVGVDEQPNNESLKKIGEIPAIHVMTLQFISLILASLAF